MGLISYSCGHISGPHKPIHVKFGVCFSHDLQKYGHENAQMQKRKFDHTSVLYKLQSELQNIQCIVGSVVTF